MSVPRFLEHDWFDRPLPDNIVLGERSWCYSSFAFLHYQSRRPCGLQVGDDTGIYNGTVFDLGANGEVVIGNFCSVVGAIIRTNCRIEIGDYSLLAHEVVLADLAWDVPPDPLLQTSDAREPETSIVLGANCWVGARAVLLRGARLGEGAIVGAGAVVDFEVAPFTVVAGNPARVVGSTAPFTTGDR
jgi:acetyltransferase-like isoleucine patch superfamily enzyme